MKSILVVLAIILSVYADNYDILDARQENRKHEYVEVKANLNNIQPFEGEGLRLPTSLTPERYFVRLQPFINTDRTIDGFVEIDFRVNEETNNVTLHIYNITIDYDSVTLFPIDDSSSLSTFTSHVNDEEKQFYIGTTSEPLTSGRTYRIQMDYTGYIGGNFEGIHISSYENEAGENINVVATQFQATEARYAFPCFDEPALKATFEMQIAREESLYHTLSNMPLVGTFDVDGQTGWVWDVFAVSPDMSTYLNALSITDFTFLEYTGVENELLNRIWGRKEAMDNSEGNYSMEIAPKILEALEVYYKIPYPLPKVDHVAIPGKGGAMENWGLVLYGEYLLLLDPVLGTAEQVEDIARVISHELAHKWFGNLVTCEWWGQLWLNEGFATIVAYLGVHLADPSLRMNELVLINEFQDCMEYDDFEGSPPLTRDVENNQEISGMFDSITYPKGGSVIRMMHYMFSEATTKQALTNYLNALSYGSGTEDLLFDYMTLQAHTDRTLDARFTVHEIMKTWTNQPGFPILNVTINGDGTATISQKRYIQVPDETATMYTYWVPISFTSGFNPDFSETNAQPRAWMMPTENEITITGLPDSSWHVFNLLSSGFYRVNYDINNWQGITDQLNTDFTVIEVRNRAEMMDDVWKIAKNGEWLIYDVPFFVSEYLRFEREYIPWVSALRELDYIKAMFTETVNYDSLKAYLEASVIPQYNRLTFNEGENDEHTQLLLRSLLVSWACDLDYAPCLSDSSAIYAEWMSTPDDYAIVTPNLKSSVYCTAIAEGSNVEWDFAMNRYLDTKRDLEKDDLRDGMTCSKNMTILDSYLDMAFSSSSQIRTSDVDNIFFGICKNGDGGNDVGWNYLTSNYHSIAIFYDNNYGMVQRFADYCAEEYKTQSDLDKVQNFYDTILPELENDDTMKELITNIERNIAWIDANYNTISTWLSNNGY